MCFDKDNEFETLMMVLAALNEDEFFAGFGNLSTTRLVCPAVTLLSIDSRAFNKQLCLYSVSTQSAVVVSLLV